MSSNASVQAQVPAMSHHSFLPVLHLLLKAFSLPSTLITTINWSVCDAIFITISKAIITPINCSYVGRIVVTNSVSSSATPAPTNTFGASNTIEAAPALNAFSFKLGSVSNAAPASNTPAFTFGSSSSTPAPLQTNTFGAANELVWWVEVWRNEDCDNQEMKWERKYLEKKNNEDMRHWVRDRHV